MSIEIRRLAPGDEAVAARLFGLLATEFDEASAPVPAAYASELLSRGDVWVVAALDGQTPIGGLTAHELPMTRSPHRELFVYDVAVHSGHRRCGIGRALFEHVLARAVVGRVTAAFVLADGDDPIARAFYRALGGKPSSAEMFTFAPDDAPRDATAADLG